MAFKELLMPLWAGLYSLSWIWPQKANRMKGKLNMNQKQTLSENKGSFCTALWIKVAPAEMNQEHLWKRNTTNWTTVCQRLCYPVLVLVSSATRLVTCPRCTPSLNLWQLQQSQPDEEMNKCRTDESQWEHFSKSQALKVKKQLCEMEAELHFKTHPTQDPGPLSACI